MKRITKAVTIPGLGVVTLQQITAAESIEWQMANIRDDGLPTTEAPFRLVELMLVDPVFDPRELRPPVFELLYEKCQEHRDYIPPEELAKNLFSGEDDSPPTESSDGPQLQASMIGSRPSVNVSFANGEQSEYLGDQTRPADDQLE